MVVQNNSVLLRFLKPKLVVNGMHIYSLAKGRPVRITLQTNPSNLVVTDGFHISSPVQVQYSAQKVRYFTIACIVENDVLVGSALFMTVLFFMGLTSGSFVLQILSISPILIMLFFYYFKRTRFLQIRAS